ncbi:MAG TPA: hypothetical protein VK307_03880 [Thermoleophilaceae bacterium]|nr:hypothetical protein [Thermoleophilaceae bacterium]
MGFMDKAKKLAEQAQQKLDEAQAQFNQSGSSQSGQPGGGPKVDEHGRPVPQEQSVPDAASAVPPPPPADPAAGFGGGPTAPASPEQPAAATGEAPLADAPPPETAVAEAPPAEEQPPPPAPPAGGANASPDPFKPLQQ